MVLEAGDQNVRGVGFFSELGGFTPRLLPLSLHIVFPPYVFLCPNFPVLWRWLFSSSVMSNSSRPHECSMPGFPVPHHLPQFVQTCVHWVNDAIQPSHPLSSPSRPAFSLSQHQGLSQWIGSLHQVTKELELQHQFFQWIFRIDFLQDWPVWSCCPRDSEESSPAPQFESISSLALSLLCTSLVAQSVKSLPAMKDTQVQYLDGEDPLEKEMATHSSIPAWRIPWTEEPGGLQRVKHDWVTSLSLFTCMHWRRKWHPTPVFLPGESQGRGSPVGCHLWGRTELDTTEVT